MYLTPLPVPCTCAYFHFGVLDATLTVGDIVRSTSPPCLFRVRVPNLTLAGLCPRGGLFGAAPLRVFQARPYPDKQQCGLSECAVRDVATGAIGGKGQEIEAEQMFSFFHLSWPVAPAFVDGPGGLCSKTDRHKTRKILDF